MKSTRASALTEAALARWPLPDAGSAADKEARGHVLVVAGSHEMPGAALLAAVAALRVGAGKLTIAAPERVAQGLALAVPESRVVALLETRAGGLKAGGIDRIGPIASRIDAVVVGPGMLDEAHSCEFVAQLLPLFAHAVTVLDALAMSVALTPLIKRRGFEQAVIMTPHAGEMAHLTDMSKETVGDEPLVAARDAAARWNACVVLKGGQTVIVDAGGAAWRHDQGGTPGLATSGSGDTLAGLICGLAARGMEPVQAAGWGVLLHARAGESLARRHGQLGYLAREISGEVPALIHSIGQRRKPR
ncbi:MAG: NAD(P)H-hydrate dehydratase [Burkholderiaceae bacterium]